MGLRPAVVEGTKDIAPLTTIRDLDPAAAHRRHHIQLPPPLAALRVTARKTMGARPRASAVDPNRPHPFTTEGNTEFNALIWMPPTGQRAVPSFSSTQPISQRCSAARPAFATSGTTSRQ